LENRRGKDNEMFRRIWKTMKTEVRETKVGEIKERRNEKKENNRSKNVGRGVEDLG